MASTRNGATAVATPTGVGEFPSADVLAKRYAGDPDGLVAAFNAGGIRADDFSAANSAIYAAMPRAKREPVQPVAYALAKGAKFGKDDAYEAADHMVCVDGVGARTIRHTDATWRAIFALQADILAAFE
jgi:hypothetical protein